MKQITVRLNDTGEKKLDKLKEIWDMKKSSTVIERVLLTHREALMESYEKDKRIRELENQVKELEIVIKHLWEKK